MNFSLTKMSEYRKYRLLEMLPGITVWSTIIIVMLLIVFKPLWMIYVAIVFDLYWLLRVWYFITYLTQSWLKYRAARKIDWFQKLKQHTDWEKYIHVVFLPTLDEPEEIIEHTLDAIATSTYPQKKVYIVLAGEERMQEQFIPIANSLKAKYENQFGGFLISVHPKDVPGEIAAKGSNLHWAGQRAQEMIDELGVPYSEVIVSAFDVDTVVDPQYFACLTSMYADHPNPTRSSFQPLAVYNNNVWESFSFARVVANSTTFWLMAELARPKPLWTFSSHAMSFKALADVGFWQSDIVTEDSRIFLQCYLYYDGEYEVTPMYIPVSMYTAHGGTLKDTVKNLYKQQRRWAWGIEHFPFMIWHFKGSTLNKKKWHLLFNLTEGMYSWATAPLLIGVLGYLPLWLVKGDDKATFVAQMAPQILQWLMLLAMGGIIFSALLNVYLLPKQIPGNRFLKICIMLLQWILLPVALILFGSIPALDAQTRMLFGKYLGFYTAKKVSEKKALPHHIEGGVGIE